MSRPGPDVTFRCLAVSHATQPNNFAAWQSMSRGLVRNRDILAARHSCQCARQAPLRDEIRGMCPFACVERLAPHCATADPLCLSGPSGPGGARMPKLARCHRTVSLAGPLRAAADTMQPWTGGAPAGAQPRAGFPATGSLVQSAEKPASSAAMMICTSSDVSTSGGDINRFGPAARTIAPFS